MIFDGKCPRCQSPMVFGLENFVLASDPPQRQFVWYCGACKFFGPTKVVSMDEGSRWEAENSNERTVMIGKHSWILSGTPPA